MSDSKVPDNQAGYEKAMTMTLAALSGEGFVYESAGMLASLLGCSIEALIIDDEMLSSLKPLYRDLGIPYHVIDPGEVAAIYPLLLPDGIFGAAHTPTDGHVDASGATHALAKAARQLGQR